MVASETEVVERWQEHFETLLNEENTWDGDSRTKMVERPIQRIEVAEVKSALQEMRSGKVGGPSELTADLLKATGQYGLNYAICGPGKGL